MPRGKRTARHKDATTFSTFELCDRAAEILKRVGFVHHQTSRQTEAAYYRWPDRPQLIRVAAHGRKRSKRRVGHRNVFACITFRDGGEPDSGMMRISEQKIESVIAKAVGLYFIRSSADLANEGGPSDEM